MDKDKEIIELKNRVAKLEEFTVSLTGNSTIPYPVGEAMKERILPDVPIVELVSNAEKAASSEDITAVTSVNFGAQTVGTNTVLDNPNGWLKVTFANVAYYIPYFT